MKRINLKTGSTIPHFIGSWFIEPPAVCDDLIDFFTQHTELQEEGKTYKGVDQDSKISTDVAIEPRDLEREEYSAAKMYIQCLYDCYTDYVEQWPFLKKADELEIGSFNIQYYSKGGHFNRLHTERFSLANSHRLLAWMTYLNDVDEGGATSFLHYDLEVKPERGKTLIWPVEWTHAHRGNIVTHGEKYIITGWMHFPI